MADQEASNFSKEEEKVLEFWEREGIFERSLEQTQDGKPYVFYEGPPTANGRPGIHHVLSRTFKDIMPRYQTMRGRFVARKAGWDTHGLPVELEVEKRLGLKSKRDIENLVPGDKRASIVKFNEECKKSVWTYLEDWQKLTRRMGYWVDLKNPYITYTPQYIESLWAIIKKFHEKGLLKKTFRVQPFCTRCGTALSSHELAQGYKKVKDQAVFLKFKITNPKAQINSKLQIPNDALIYLLSWTTTPWTLPGNVALAIDKKITYVVVKYEIRNTQYSILVLAKNRLNILTEPCELLGELKGSELVGLRYEPLFNIPELQNEKSHRLYGADFVTATEGTGLVHTAVMYGEDDYNLGEQIGLPKVPTVNEDGTFNDLVPGFAGRYVKAPETEAALLEHLKTQGALLKEEICEHDYPYCWRCSTPLLYMARTAWVVEMSRLRKDLVKNNRKIVWEPEHIKEGRFGEWLREVKDWTFSRERYWGTPLPVWECQTGKSQIPNPNPQTPNTRHPDGCGEFVVIGSFEELRKMSVVDEEITAQAIKDPHRPYIDDVTFTCSCGGQMKRVPYVCDVWFDSGSMPYAQAHWPFAGAQAKNEKRKMKNNDLADILDTKYQILDTSVFPADYISEAVDQTRGWFYTLHAVATALGFGPAFKRVVCLGLIMDAKGEKMSKSKGNIVDPWDQIAKFGVDPVRWYFFVASLPGIPKRYDERAIGLHYNKFFATLWNTLRFLELYAPQDNKLKSNLVARGALGKLPLLDQWIILRARVLVARVTKNIDSLQFTTAAREIEEFVEELSNWYVRRSRGRLQAGKDSSRSVLASVLKTLSELLAPFIPFFSERLYQGLKPFIKGELAASVHLAAWPKAAKVSPADEVVIKSMSQARAVVADGLKQRMAAGLKIRQPLAGAEVYVELSEELLKVVAEELNIKSIKYQVSSIKESSESIKLDTQLTPELIDEMRARELYRSIQVWRKVNKLKLSDQIEVYIDGVGGKVLEKLNNIMAAIKVGNIKISIPPMTSGEFEDISNTPDGLKLVVRRTSGRPNT